MYLVTQSCSTLCNPVDCSPPGSSVHGDFPGNNNWSGFPCPPPGDLSNPGIKPRSPALQADSLWSEPSEKPIHTQVHANTGEIRLNDVYSLAKSLINVNFLVLIIRYYNYIRYHHQGKLHERYMKTPYSFFASKISISKNTYIHTYMHNTQTPKPLPTGITYVNLFLSLDPFLHFNSD